MALTKRFAPVMAVAALAVVLSGCFGPKGAPARPTVILYGDSLSWEARGAFQLHLGPEVDVVHRNFPGVAICDYLDEMATDVVVLRPRAVVLEFAGNVLTPCVRGLTGSALVDKYARDAAAATDLFTARGVPVYLIGGPVLPGWDPDPTARLHHAYAAVAGRAGPLASFTDAGRAVLDAQGRYTDTLPCLPVEGPPQGCAGGRITVRSPDRVHFCPVVGHPCPVWSSGAWRFGAAMAAPVRRDLGL
ncbi:MAG: hypothetical protein ACRDZV_11105 [Acidimicrobiia bacterium]